MSSTTKPLILHAHATGPNPIKIAMALEFLQTPYTIKMWDFGDDAQTGVKGTSFTKINENGRVPALEDPNTGVVSWESGAIMNYLRRVYDKSNTLGPRGSTEQDIVDLEKWEYFLLSTLGPMTGQVNWFRHYHPSKNEDALSRYVEQTERCYGIVEGQLGKTGGRSILEGGISAADLHFEPWVRQHEFAGLSLERYPNLRKWLEGMGGREEVREAYRKIKEAGKPGE